MVKIISLSAGLWDMNIHRIQFLPIYVLASLVAQMVKNMPAMRETWGSIPGFGRSREESMATHSSVLAWRIPLDRGAWRATVLGVKELDMTE